MQRSNSDKNRMTEVRQCHVIAGSDVARCLESWLWAAHGVYVMNTLRCFGRMKSNDKLTLKISQEDER